MIRKIILTTENRKSVGNTVYIKVTKEYPTDKFFRAAIRMDPDIIESELPIPKDIQKLADCCNINLVRKEIF